MAALGGVRVARVALRVSQAVLPASRRTFSTPQLTPPQRLAMLCLRRDEDWTCRDAEVRLAAQGEWRAALGLHSVPADTPLDRWLRRLDEAVLAQIRRALVERLLPTPGPQAVGAVEATGLTPGAISPFCVKRAQAREPGVTWRPWVTWPMVVDVDRRIIWAQTARRGPSNDGATWRPWGSAAHEQVPSSVVLADAACDRERHHQPLRQPLQAQRSIPAQRGGARWRMHGVRAERRPDCPAALDRRRSLLESVISAVKRTLSTRASGRSLATPSLQALLLGLASNVYRR
jgi:hypothetical protein